MIPDANVKDLMLRAEVVEAVSQGRFRVYAVKTVDQGIEILTGRPAGARGADGKYPKDSVNALADARLTALAEGLRDFAAKDGEEKAVAKKGKRKSGEKPLLQREDAS
jgi:Lon-like ATP-dependent protease